MRIIRDYIPNGRRNRPGHTLNAKYITIHDTGNSAKGADARNHARYLKTADVIASWHFTVDDGEIVQHLPLNEIGWHAGDGASGPGNRQSIGIEICMNADGDRTKAEKNAAALVARLLKELDLPISAVKQHYDWTRKNCPQVIRARPGGWDGFISAIKEEMRSMDKAAEKEMVLPTQHSAEAAPGTMRYNRQTGRVEVFSGGAWRRMLDERDLALLKK